ncbi:MAG: peptidase U32 family protein [Desulfobacteraceae bacterium]|jgi:putative protease
MFELLAPGGDVDSIKAAIAAGADAVYCGLNKFNARNRATNIGFEELNGIIHLAHTHHCKVFLTLNILVLQAEIPDLISVLNKLSNTNIDGVIVQDLGVFYILSHYFKGLSIHASTQLNTHNEGQIHFLSKLNATRVNLAREMNIHEITSLISICHDHNMLTEVFVHGSYCISFSGLCYISSVLGGRSGNRGRCSQPCRDRYVTTPQGKDFPLNLKDNSAFLDVRALANAGVDSLKIEGRMKQCDYVYTVVDCWRKQLQSFEDADRPNDHNRDLYKVFNRDFSNGYLKGEIHKDMFIDSPRDHSIDHLSEINKYPTLQDLVNDQNSLYDEKMDILAEVKRRISPLSIAQSPLNLSISGKSGSPLTVSVETRGLSFCVCSQTNLEETTSHRKQKNKGLSLNHEALLKELDFLNHTEYVIENLCTDELQPGISLSFKEFKNIKDRIFSELNDSKERFRHIDVPRIKKFTHAPVKPSLAVLIASPDDVDLNLNTSADVFYQLPNGFKHDEAALADLFSNNTHLIPWFPSVLIGENYDAAVDFLRKIQPGRLVTDNTGIAFESYKKGIPWIAGPHLNCVNSFSLCCLKENFNGNGAFISNEISKRQLKGLHAPEDFNIFYSIFHPIMLLSSRQCLFRQVVGCQKPCFDEECLHRCSKSATLTTMNHQSLFIEKTKGNYPCIHHPAHYLNTDIIRDFPGMFSTFLIDLRQIHTEANMEADKAGIIRLFENLLNDQPDSEKAIRQIIHPTTNSQYKKGI